MLNKESIISMRICIGRGLYSAEWLLSKETLLRSGFLFDFHTHHVISKKKSNEFVFCYNYGYHLTEGGRYKIVKRFDDADVFV